MFNLVETQHAASLHELEGEGVNIPGWQQGYSNERKRRYVALVGGIGSVAGVVAAKLTGSLIAFVACFLLALVIGFAIAAIRGSDEL